MTRPRLQWLAVLAWYEFARFDIAHALFRWSALRTYGAPPLRLARCRTDVDREICDAILLASCFYVKPVLCLQRAVSAARLLRSRGVPATLVVGYRPSPLMAHAWVEVDGRVVGDSPVYAERLHVLYRTRA
jgi:Transglutaminase-like superfamily